MDERPAAPVEEEAAAATLAADPSLTAARRSDEALSGDASGSIVRGAAIRGLTFVFSTGLIALAFAVVFREVSPQFFARLSVAVAIATIVQNIGELSIGAVAQRLLVAASAEERPALHARLVGTRFVVMPVAIAAGVAFAAIFYDAELVRATLIVCTGALFSALLGAYSTPLAIELRVGRLSATDTVRQLGVAAGLLVAVAASASLAGYAAVYLVAPALGLLVALVLVDRTWRRIARPDRATLTAVARQASWLALAITVNSLFLKILTVIASLRTTELETGLFGAATRITEVVAGLSLLMAGIAYPLLNRAVADEDWPRLANAVHRIVDGVLLLVGSAAIVLIVAAEPIVQVFTSGGAYADAAPVLQVQAVALCCAATTQALVWALLALHAERLLVITNLIGLAVLTVAGVILIGPYGATGAAEAGIIGESVLLIVTLIALRRARADVVPSPVRIAAVAAVVAVCCLLGLVVPIAPVLAAIVALLAFGAISFATGLVPRELLASVPLPRAAARS